MFTLRKSATAILSGSVIVLAIGGCATTGDLPSMGNAFALTSSTFRDGTMLAVKNAGNNKSNPNCIGENISPPLAWSNVPAGTKSFALIMVDPEGRGGLGVDHWNAYGIPASRTGFAEGETSTLSDKYVGGKGTAGLGHYTGPCTPPGSGLHHYTFTLIATDLEPNALPAGLTRAELLAKLVGHTKGSAGLIGLFGRAAD
jgi:Raf kinase inhibitor-like YbhB/YbcL family protein